jgi:hypothetical protein
VYYYAPPVGSPIREGFLILEGGYGARCATRTNDARSTVLSGDGYQTIKLYPTNGAVWFRSLSFDGVSTSTIGPVNDDEICPVSGLVFDATRVRVDNGMMQFIGKCHDVTLRDSLIVNAFASDLHYVRDTALDVLAAQLPGAILFRRAGAGDAAPQERMRARQRRRHHALADRLEHLGLAEVGNEEAERQRGALRTAPDERAGAGAPLDEAGGLEVTHGPADRDPRRAEEPLQLRLARQPVARRQAA